jgi:molybdate transport system substrate-binding protein
VRSLADLARPGVKISIGAEGVPIGDYTRKVLSGLPAAQAKAILANVRSNDPDVASIAGRVAQGGADAGFVYVTDVRASGGKLRAVDIPDALEPTVVYAAAVVKGAKHPEQAKAFIDGLRSGAGQAALRQAGFGAAPGT